MSAVIDQGQPVQSMPAIDALAVELDIKTDIKPGQSVTETGQPAPPQKSLADFIPVDVLLGFIVSLIWKIVQKVSSSARDVDMTDGEIKTLANAWAPVMEEHMPNIPDGNLSNALIATSFVALPKYMEVKKKQKQKAKQEKDAQSEPGKKQEPEKTAESAEPVEKQKETLQPESSRKK